MNFLERLDSLLEERNLNKNQLANATGIPVSTVYGWYKKGYSSITLPSLLKLSEFFKCSMEYLVNGNPASSNQPSSAALDLARKYDRLNEYSKKVITALVDLELKRPFSADSVQVGAAMLAQGLSDDESSSSLTHQAASE